MDKDVLQYWAGGEPARSIELHAGTWSMAAAAAVWIAAGMFIRGLGQEWYPINWCCLASLSVGVPLSVVAGCLCVTGFTQDESQRELSMLSGVLIGSAWLVCAALAQAP